MKRTNEAEQPAEEIVEPRAGAKENAQQDGTPRTPGRQGASHGLERVRHAASETQGAHKSLCKSSYAIQRFRESTTTSKQPRTSHPIGV